MPSSTTHSHNRRPFAAPAIVSVLLLLLLAGAFYRLYDLNLRDVPQNAALLKEELVRKNALREENSRLEGWLDKTPCEVKALLQGASLSPARLPNAVPVFLGHALQIPFSLFAASQHDAGCEATGGRA